MEGLFNVFKRPSSPKASAPPSEAPSLYPTVTPPSGSDGILIESKDDGNKYLQMGSKPPLPTSGTPSIYPTIDGPDPSVVRLAREGGGSGAYPVVVAWKPGQKDGQETISQAAVSPVSAETESASVANHVADVAALKAAKLTAANEAEKIEEGEQEPQVPASEEVLVAVPGVTEVHLVTGDQSVLIGRGDFRILRISQGNTGLMVVVKVGDELTWPVLGSEPVAKISDRRYLVTVLVPREPGDEDEDEAITSTYEPTLSKTTSKRETVKNWFSWSKKSVRKPTVQGGPKTADLMSYGVTFEENLDPKYLATLDDMLSRYATFTVQPAMGAIDGQAVVPPVSPSGRNRDEKFWSEVAPNVDEYNSTAAKQIAKTTGYVIRAVIGAADTTASTIESSGSYVKGRTTAATKDSNVSPFVLRSVRRVRKFSKMTDDVASATLNGVIRVTGFFTGAAIKSVLGQKVIKMLPGEVVLVSLDAFGKLLDALEISSKTVLQTSSVVTSDVIGHKYGSKAGEVTSETLKTGGHVLHTAWTVSKLRNILNPKAAVSSGTGITKVVTSTASVAHKVTDMKKTVDAMKATTEQRAKQESEQMSVDQAAGTSVAGQLAKTAVKHAVFGKKQGPGFVEQVGQIALNHVVDQLKNPSSPKAASSSGTAPSTPPGAK